jgi:L-rhamnose-H+ transport protein
MNPIVASGVAFAAFSGLCNGLFSAPMKLERRWKWENIWLVFIVVSCLVMPGVILLPAVHHLRAILAQAPSGALQAALLFGFLWGFGAICFGRSVDQLGVAVANTLVIGLSSALGSLVPLIIVGPLANNRSKFLLFGGVAAFILGVIFSGSAGRSRDRSEDSGSGTKRQPSFAGYLYAILSGVMSAIFNIGYTLALPIADTGVRLGNSSFAATNCIWLLMLGAGSIPNIAYCGWLMRRNATASLLFEAGSPASWGRSLLMGLLWGGSIFLYGAATPRLGSLGPSIGWPLSLAVGLLVANLMGLLLGEWRRAGARAIWQMRAGIVTLLVAIGLCAMSSGAAS